MTSMRSKLIKIRDALAGIDGLDVFHYWHLRDELPYCVWEETTEAGSLMMGNHKMEQAIGGVVEFYTKDEFDPLVDDIQDALNGVDGLSFYLNLAEYDEQLNAIRKQWVWRII